MLDIINDFKIKMLLWLHAVKFHYQLFNKFYTHAIFSSFKALFITSLLFPLKADNISFSLLLHILFRPICKDKGCPRPLPQRLATCIRTSDWVRWGTWSLVWNDCNQGEGKDKGRVQTLDISYNQTLIAGAVIEERRRKRMRRVAGCHVSCFWYDVSLFFLLLLFDFCLILP